MKSRSILFITGASVMILQIIGVRILATQLGTTSVVWSSMIATTIASLAIGYYLGGVLADRGTTQKMRALFVGAAGIMIALVVPMRSVVFLIGTSLPYGIRAIIVSIILFSIPIILLAATTIYTTRMESSNISSIGSTSGTLYAVSTLGSLAGVFFASFYLIPSFSISTILYSLAGIILITGIRATSSEY